MGLGSAGRRGRQLPRLSHKERSELWEYLIPGLVTLITAVIGAITAVTTHKRERRVTEIHEAFEDRGKFVDSLKDRLEFLEKRDKECQADLDEMRERVKALEALSRQR